MNYNFYLVDDDVSVLSILSKIVINQNLGDVIGKATDGEKAMEEIKALKPDIVFVDLLLPKCDGISLVNQLKRQFSEMPFIMISEVYSKEMVSKAYNNGVEYYINKPINVIEVINVVKRVDEKLKMKKVINSFQNAFQNMKSLDVNQDTNAYNSVNLVIEEARSIFSQLGILSEAGTKDLIHIIEFVFASKEWDYKQIFDHKLSDLYTYLSTKYEKEKGDSVNEKAIEQRIRRSISQAISNIAELGLDNYEHLTFERFSSTLFDFREVRKEMDYIKKLSKNRGKISIRKFIAGVVLEIQNSK